MKSSRAGQAGHTLCSFLPFLLPWAWWFVTQVIIEVGPWGILNLYYSLIYTLPLPAHNQLFLQNVNFGRLENEKAMTQHWDDEQNDDFQNLIRYSCFLLTDKLGNQHDHVISHLGSNVDLSVIHVGIFAPNSLSNW